MNGMPVTLERAIEALGKYRHGLKVMSGGFTLSGGEPLMQDRFAVRLFTAAKAMGIHTALDTNGFLGERLTDEEIWRQIDLVLLDIKSWDPERHRHLTGKDVGPTLDFARRLAAPEEADLAALCFGARINRRCTRTSRRSPSSPPGWATSSELTYCPFIRWADSNGRSSDSTTRSTTSSLPRVNWSSAFAANFAPQVLQRIEGTGAQ